MPKRICWKNLYIPFDTFARKAVSLHKTEAGIWGNRTKIIYAWQILKHFAQTATQRGCKRKQPHMCKLHKNHPRNFSVPPHSSAEKCFISSSSTEDALLNGNF